MKILFRAFIVASIAVVLVASRAAADDTPAPAPSTNVFAPPVAEKTNALARKAAQPATKAVAKKIEVKPEVKPEPVWHPEPGVTKQNNVNVRGQASMNSEVITRLQKNDPVTILELISLKKPKQDEPQMWYRIALPTNVAVWINTSFIDAATKTVKPRRLNLRGGPGENYSILGRLERGAAVNPIDTKGEWTKIEPPTNAFGFVAAHLVERTPAPAIVAAPKPPEPTNPPPIVAEVPTTPAAVAPAEPVTPPVTAPPATTPTPVVTPAPAEPAVEAPVEKVKKIVSREGILKGSVSIQAPTYFELRSLDTGKTIDYVYSPSTNLVLKQYKGKRIIVTGEEVLDERWQHTPVIVIDALQTVP
jgi:uncharacterized protein YgiM (DUF1202 family)